MSTPRPGARGPAVNTHIDTRCVEIRACLKSLGLSTADSQIAAILTLETGDLVTAAAVRARFRRMGR